MLEALALRDWGDIAQLVIAGTALVALIVGGAQLLVARKTAQRERVWSYQEQVNRLTFRRRSVRYREYWESHTYAQYDSEGRLEKNEKLMLPNLMEEVGSLYNRRLLDKKVAAQTLGIYVEELWCASTPFIEGLRHTHDKRAFCEWEKMQDDTWQRRGALGPMGKATPGLLPRRTLRWYLSAEFRRDLSSEYRRQLRLGEA
jgi:hypothetical protein